MEYIRASSVYTGIKWSRGKYESGHTKCPGAKMTHWSCSTLSHHVLDIETPLEYEDKLQQALLSQCKYFYGKYSSDGFFTMHLHVSLIGSQHVATPPCFQGLSS